MKSNLCNNMWQKCPLRDSWLDENKKFPLRRLMRSFTVCIYSIKLPKFKVVNYLLYSLLLIFLEKNIILCARVSKYLNQILRRWRALKENFEIQMAVVGSTSISNKTLMCSGSPYKVKSVKFHYGIMQVMGQMSRELQCEFGLNKYRF